MAVERARRGGDRRLLAAAGAAVAAALALLASGCGASAAPPEPYSAALPSGSALTRAEVVELLGSLNDKTLDRVPGPPLPASVFALDDARPQPDHPQWLALLADLQGARDTAVREGWTVLVEGWTDSTGTAARNAVLSQERADATRSTVLGLGYPPERVAAHGRGVGGTAETDRRVVVTFVRQQRSAP